MGLREAWRVAGGCTVPTMEEPFCMSCESLLGAPVPAQGLDEMAHDPHCRKCGFVNPHGPDGTLLTHARVAVTELEPSKVMADAQERAAEAYLNTVDEIAAAASVNVRPTTEQRCEECGWKTAYYWSAQVRGADEGQTAFFQCVRCQHVWSIK